MDSEQWADYSNMSTKSGGEILRRRWATLSKKFSSLSTWEKLSRAREVLKTAYWLLKVLIALSTLVVLL
ncbi:hypothetical protein [Haloferax larsenii]|uniref:Uncharacterized protein n=1 Tax=Haloferax larsenii TaxID=302484 RepID=A0ABY5RFW5_HALLR|nr:hypothetical protein [Haloferax larsenii]ELZ77050.1 hypothetical protein C455_14722 [Haloferax larsenii JCM 13917]UVE51267.1 hypothetical protein KU306_05120 [Haloferax larsenii]